MHLPAGKAVVTNINKLAWFLPRGRPWLGMGGKGSLGENSRFQASPRTRSPWQVCYSKSCGGGGAISQSDFCQSSVWVCCWGYESIWHLNKTKHKTTKKQGKNTKQKVHFSRSHEPWKVCQEKSCDLFSSGPRKMNSQTFLLLDFPSGNMSKSWWIFRESWILKRNLETSRIVSRSFWRKVVFQQDFPFIFRQTRKKLQKIPRFSSTRWRYKRCVLILNFEFSTFSSTKKMLKKTNQFDFSLKLRFFQQFLLAGTAFKRRKNF